MREFWLRLTWRIAWRWDWSREAARVYGSMAGAAGHRQRAQDRGMPSRTSRGESASPHDQVLPKRHPAGFESRVASWGSRQLSWGPGLSGRVKAQGPCSQHLSDPRPRLSSCVTRAASTVSAGARRPECHCSHSRAPRRLSGPQWATVALGTSGSLRVSRSRVTRREWAVVGMGREGAVCHLPQGPGSWGPW